MTNKNKKPINYCCICGNKVGKPPPFKRAVTDDTVMLGLICAKCLNGSNNDNGFEYL